MESSQELRPGPALLARDLQGILERGRWLGQFLLNDRFGARTWLLHSSQQSSAPCPFCWPPTVQPPLCGTSDGHPASLLHSGSCICKACLYFGQGGALCLLISRDSACALSLCGMPFLTFLTAVLVTVLGSHSLLSTYFIVLSYC